MIWEDMNLVPERYAQPTSYPHSSAGPPTDVGDGDQGFNTYLWTPVVERRFYASITGTRLSMKEE